MRTIGLFDLSVEQSGKPGQLCLLHRISVVQIPLPSIGTDGPCPMTKALARNHESTESRWNPANVSMRWAHAGESPRRFAQVSSKGRSET